MNGKLKFVKARKQTTSDTEEDDYDEDEEMPEEVGTPAQNGTSERDGRYIPIRTNPEEDALQLHTDGEISCENIETNIRRDSKKPNRYGTIPYTGNFRG